MPRRPRRNHGPAFKAKVAVAAIKGEKTLIEMAQDVDVHPNRIKQWRDPLLQGATGVFGDAPKAEPEPMIDVKTLHAKIGELTLENDAPQGLRGPTGATVPAPMSGALGKAGLLPSAKRRSIPPRSRASVGRPSCWGSAGAAHTTSRARFRTPISS